MASYRRLKSGKWQATVRLPDGRRRTRTDPLKGVVRTWAEDAEARLRRGEWADPQDGRVTMAEWHKAWSAARDIERSTALRDASHWRVHVEPRWGGVRLAAITALDVETWLVQMKRTGVGATTVNQSFRLLRHILTDAVRHKMIMSNPTEGIPAPPIPKHIDRFLTHAEFEALHDELPTDRDKAIALLMGYCGLRWQEVAGLHSHRVDVDRGQLWVQEVQRRDGTVKDIPKSRAGQRLVPMPPHVADAVVPFLGGGLLFPGLHYTNWRRRVFAPAVKRAGLAEPYPTPHDLRHSYGSWLAEQGVPATDIMALMGHGSLRATERYLHSGDGRFDRARAALSMAPGRLGA